MKIAKICMFAILIALGATLALDAPAFACEPRSETDPRCQMAVPKPRVVARPAPTPTAVQPTIVASTKTVVPSSIGGQSPSDSIVMNETWESLNYGIYQEKWQTIKPNSTKWYSIQNGNLFWYTVLWLDAKNKDLLMNRSFELMSYSPEQEKELIADGLGVRPKGRAWPTKYDAVHDFLLTSKHTYGTWWFVLRNDNPNPLEYRLTYWRAPDTRECGSVYDEINAFGQWIKWQDCGMYGLNKK